MDWPSRASQRLYGVLGLEKTRIPCSNMKRDRIDVEIPLYRCVVDKEDLRSIEISMRGRLGNVYFGDGFSSTVHRRKSQKSQSHQFITQQLPRIQPHLHSESRTKAPPKEKRSDNNLLKKLLRICVIRWLASWKLSPLRCAICIVFIFQVLSVLHFLLVIFNLFPTFTSLLPTSVIQKQLSIMPKNETALLLPGKALNYQCVAWRATSDCSPDGPRLSDSAISTFTQTDLPCDKVVPTMGSGYCELRSPSGGIIKAVKKSCRQGYPRLGQYQPYFKCDMAASFLAYKDRALQYEPSPPIQSNDVIEGLEPTRGIVIGVYPRLLASAYAIIRSLREIHNCHLPIEIWCIRGELSEENPLIKTILMDGNVHFRSITDSNVHSFMAKPYSIAYSKFDQVLFLDSDNFPMRDPTYLFDTPEFQSTGALFWKDYWMASRDEFFVTRKSLIWELLGIPSDSSSVNEQELESGQIVIDRKKGEKALKVLLFLAKTFDEFIEPMSLLLGDKDLFRLAWHMTQSPFHYARDPPGLAGPSPVSLLSKNKVCGMSFVQYDPSGNPIFFHRNFAKIVQEPGILKRILGIFFGSPIFPSTVWEKGVKFTGDNPETQYAISNFVSIWQENMCYHPRADVRDYFEETDYRGTEVELLDHKILGWAFEGMKINS